MEEKDLATFVELLGAAGRVWRRLTGCLVHRGVGDAPDLLGGYPKICAECLYNDAFTGEMPSAPGASFFAAVEAVMHELGEGPAHALHGLAKRAAAEAPITLPTDRLPAEEVENVWQGMRFVKFALDPTVVSLIRKHMEWVEWVGLPPTLH